MGIKVARVRKGAKRRGLINAHMKYLKRQFKLLVLRQSGQFALKGVAQS